MSDNKIPRMRVYHRYLGNKLIFFQAKYPAPGAPRKVVSSNSGIHS